MYKGITEMGRGEGGEARIGCSSEQLCLWSKEKEGIKSPHQKLYRMKGVFFRKIMV